MPRGVFGRGCLAMANSPLASPKATREVLARHGHSPRKSLGQNFLVDDNVVGRILELAGLGGADGVGSGADGVDGACGGADWVGGGIGEIAGSTEPAGAVLEVGPGIGTLTAALLSRAPGVIAIERDPSLPEVLADTLVDDWHRLALIEKDALNVTRDDVERAAKSLGQAACVRGGAAESDMAAVKRDAEAAHCGSSSCFMPTKLVANLPYAVAATVVLDYFQQFDFLDSMTVMVQREVAQRMQATPGTKNYGAYSVKLSLYAQAVGSFGVSPGCFLPAPHVESTVIRLNRSNACESMLPEVVRAACTMADAAFFARRKTISNSFKQFFSGRSDLPADRIPQLLSMANIAPGVRGETLELADFERLARAYLNLHA